MLSVVILSNLLVSSFNHFLNGCSIGKTDRLFLSGKVLPLTSEILIIFEDIISILRVCSGKVINTCVLLSWLNRKFKGKRIISAKKQYFLKLFFMK